MSSKAVEPLVSIVPSIMGDEDKAKLRDQFDRQIAEATTLDELFAKTETLGLEDVEGTPITVEAVRFVKGREEFQGEDSLGAFVVVEFTRSGGKGTEVLTTGARTPLMILYKIAEFGGFPIRLRFLRSRTGNDREAWNVERVA